MADISGVIVTGSPPVPTNGVTIKVWTPSQTGGSLPAQGTVEPGGSPVATTTTAAATGTDGSFLVTGLVTGTYYLSWTVGGVVYWAERLAIKPLPGADAWTVTATGGLQAPLYDKGGAVYNVKGYGAVGDGSTDDTTAIQNAINAANTAAGGLVFLPRGTYISQTLTLYTGVTLLGCGIDVTTIKLKNAANADLIVGANFATLTGTGNHGGITQWMIKGMTLDGNKANQTSGTSWPLRVYGYAYVLEDVDTRNGRTGGLYSEWSTFPYVAPGIEAQLNRVRAHDNSGIGIQWRGPHDSMWQDVLSYINTGTGVSFETDNTNYNGGVTQWINGHTYSNGVIGVQMGASGVRAINCQFEVDNTTTNTLQGVLVTAYDCQIKDGSIFGSLGAVAAGAYGLQLGSVGNPVERTLVDTNIRTTPGGLVNFANDAGHNSISIVGDQASGPLYAGTVGELTRFACITAQGILRMLPGADIHQPYDTVVSIGANAVSLALTHYGTLFEEIRIAVTGANRTGGILAVGTYDGQQLTLLNGSAFSWSFDTTTATSHVANNGTAITVQPWSMKQFRWDAYTAFWYAVG